MLIAIVGGGLQGVEIAYLSKKTGFKVMVLDKAPDPPAKGLADTFVQVDICRNDKASFYLEKADFILPALENDKALETLHLWQKSSSTPLCFDMKAYKISSSKQKSNALFSKLGIPKPHAFPECGFPVVIKPSSGSGSQGVKIISSKDEWGKSFKSDEWVMEEYISGPSYSLEIIGRPDRYETLQVTELYMDKNYDCKQVVAPAKIKAELVRQFENSAKTIASNMKLNGIMDFEVILHKGKMKMLEIDARFPSQTPMAVYASTGMNMVEILAQLTLNQKTDLSSISGNKGLSSDHAPGHLPYHSPGIAPHAIPDPVMEHAIIEHILVSPKGIEIRGENIMKSCGSLHLETNFFGADEAVTSFIAGCSKWVATLIIKGKTSREAKERNKQILDNIGFQCNLPLRPDTNPYEII
ncbi:3-methylornithine--L-lysine ligase PylC [Desulfobacula sp.]